MSGTVLKTRFHYSAALMISSATSFGNDSIATWLDGTSIAVALAAFAWSLSNCGGKIASFVPATKGRLLPPRGLAHRSGKGPDVERSLRRSYDCLFFGRKVGREISLDA